MRYTIIVERGDDPGNYVVSVPALPDCFTQGSSVDQALERIREAITGHIAALADPSLRSGQALGEPIPVETDPPFLTAVDVDPAAPPYSSSKFTGCPA